ANELKTKISQKQAEAFQISQQRDSTFPKRLIEYKQALPESDFTERVLALTKKQEQLKKFDISTSIQEFTAYEGDNKKVLSVYLEDAEEKTVVFNDLLARLNLFVELLAEKQFTLKSIEINRKQGICITTRKGHVLNLTDLSSGEQEEMVLLYELLFRVNQNTLVLLDEPEISLHVVWQKNFIQDLLKIAKIQDINFLVATHSPQIINSRWDLTIDLYNLYEAADKKDE
ncbi:MAG: AAA family ATPase, partial [Bacteroidales bacterium]|nr:AAA family ATPase [Bacteroidales bacterium]